jgi:ribosomal protein S18 acetylase RimI-like enzyme
MLRPATVVDLPIVRALIREGAARGSFDRTLAADSPGASQFFAKLRQALATGYFVEEDTGSGGLTTSAVPGYMFVPESDRTAHRPIGFGLFRAAAAGYELWLTAIDPAWRGHGHGRGMLAELLDTPPGRAAYVVRIAASDDDSPTVARLLESLGYGCARETPKDAWYLRDDAPEVVRRAFGPVAANRTSS